MAICDELVDEALAEIAASKIDHPAVDFTESLIRVREHGDLGVLAEEWRNRPVDPETNTGSFFRWGALIAGRDFAGAEETLALLNDEEMSHLGATDRELAGLVTYWFLGQQDKAEELGAGIRKRINDAAAEFGFDPLERLTALTFALLAALEGDTAEAERFVRIYSRNRGADWAERVNNRDLTCQILGMAGAAQAAVQCIRDGLEEPSMIMPFVEPLLPYYDPIRETPEFIALEKELGVSVLVSPHQ